jgi:hypothetical protein
MGQHMFNTCSQKLGSNLDQLTIHLIRHIRRIRAFPPVRSFILSYERRSA